MGLGVLSAIRVQILARGARWKAAPTTVSGLPFAAKTKRLGLKLGPTSILKRKLQFQVESRLSKPSFPPFFNWRNNSGQNLVSSVKDQGDCGSCVAFACVAVLESQLMISRQGTHSLSEAFLFFCGQGDCENGWDIEPALKFLEDPGVTDGGCLPYSAFRLASPCSRCCRDWKSRLYKISGYREIATPDFAKAWISRYGPLVAAMDVYEDFLYYANGAYSHVYGANIGQHAIALVGYDDVSGYWICKNSWGTGWGEEGLFALEFGQCNVCVQYPMWGVSRVVAPVGVGA